MSSEEDLQVSISLFLIVTPPLSISVLTKEKRKTKNRKRWSLGRLDSVLALNTSNKPCHGTRGEGRVQKKSSIDNFFFTLIVPDCG